MSKIDGNVLNSFNEFSNELYQKMVEGKHGNVVFSPISIQTALSFAMFGASEETLRQLKNGLKYEDIAEETLLQNFQKLCEKLEKFDSLKIANKIYLKENYSIKPKFKEIATKNFHSEVESIDFEKNVEAAEHINQWVESKTNNKIKNLIKADLLDEDTRLILINTIYFKDCWANEFDSSKSYSGSFYLNDEEKVEADFMKLERSFQYVKLDGLDANAVQLPHKNSNCSMMIILPNSKTGLPALENKLNKINFGDLSKKMWTEKVEVRIPKFKIEFKIDLEEPLKKMGMKRMFSDDAEFDNLLDSPDLIKVSKVIHKAVIEVGEKGTEAAAATAMCIGVTTSGKRYRKQPIYFVADHPFLFVLIQDSKVFFVGRKVD